METATQSIISLQNLAIHVVMCIILLAVPVAAVVEIFKSGLRTAFYKRIFTTWWEERSESAKYAVSSWLSPRNVAINWMRLGFDEERLRSLLDALGDLGLGDIPQYSSFHQEGLPACKLPRDLFMKKIENIARTIVEQSSGHSRDFIILTDGAPPADQHLVIAADLIERSKPDLLSLIQTETRDVTEFHPAIIAAQNQAATVLERNLDDLQLRLMRLWPLSIRAFGVFTGLVMALFGGWWITGLTINVGFWISIAVIGIGAGVFANFVHDVATIFARIRRP